VIRNILVRRTLRVLWANETGVTAIEYGLIAALISVVIVTAISLVGAHLSTTFSTIATKL
jgi:pilus assembly protein Flp/PilA